MLRDARTTRVGGPDEIRQPKTLTLAFLSAALFYLQVCAFWWSKTKER
jgi:hypothetical protein